MYPVRNISSSFLSTDTDGGMTMTSVKFDAVGTGSTVDVHRDSPGLRRPGCTLSKLTDSRSVRANFEGPLQVGGVQAEERQCRFYSISQPGSWEPLGLSQATFENLVKFEQISDDIYGLVSSFRTRESQTEEALSSHCYLKRGLGNIEFGYVFKYPEVRNRPSGAIWSIRQTAIYSKLMLGNTVNSTWVFLHPRYEAPLKEQLDAALNNPTRTSEGVECPSKVHVLAISTYMDNWRPYLAYIEEDLLNLSMPYIGAPGQMNEALREKTLVRIRYLEGLVQPAINIFDSTLHIIRRLESFNDIFNGYGQQSNKLSTEKDDLENLAQQVRSYAGYAKFLVRKLGSTAQLFSDGLALKNQRIVQEQSEMLSALTKVTARDSATIRVITVVTAVFLPTTSVATFFGAEMFYLTPEHRIAISQDIWIFIVAAVVLTAVTLVFLWLRKQQHENERDALTMNRKQSDSEKGC